MLCVSWSLGIFISIWLFNCHLVYYSHFDALYREKSGNPGFGCFMCEDSVLFAKNVFRLWTKGFSGEWSIPVIYQTINRTCFHIGRLSLEAMPLSILSIVDYELPSFRKNLRSGYIVLNLGM
jgi:hypothetical protein